MKNNLFPAVLLIFCLGSLFGGFVAVPVHECFFKEEHVPTEYEIITEKLDTKRKEIFLKEAELQLKRLDEELKKPTGSVGSAEPIPFPFNPRE